MGSDFCLDNDASEVGNQHLSPLSHHTDSNIRVGGNFQDLVTRALCCLLGAVWGGLAYGADNGNPYVMAVFAAIYMIPMIYRFTQSNHPRSGIVGCISFVVVSLGAEAADGLPSIAHIAWARGVAFMVGVVAAVVINWLIWPFVARHELRKALSSMLIYSSIIYRGVVAKYVYYEKGEEPQKEDIERSGMSSGPIHFISVTVVRNARRSPSRRLRANTTVNGMCLLPAPLTSL